MDAAMGSTQRLTAFLIRHDNRLLGVVLGLTALHTWANLYARAGRYAAYMGYGVIATPGLSLLAIGCSAVYLTAVSAILLTARKPLARYNTLGPNLMAVVAGFGVYAFSLLPPAPQPRVDLLLPLALLAAGTATVLLALVYLRRAFSVTPQARGVVRAGPYSLVRHPMYVGNILYIAGMGLLLGTGPALLLALLLCALQGVRARYEERLLAATFADYAAYARQVPGFVPKGRAGLVCGVLLALLCGLLLAPSLAQAQVPAPGMGARCQAWHQKALSGEWVSVKERDEFAPTELVEEQLLALPACKAFFALTWRCQKAWMDTVVGHPPKPMLMLTAVQNVPGCKSVIGVRKVCEQLDAAVVARLPLSAPLKALLPVCLDRQIGERTGDFMRSAL